MIKFYYFCWRSCLLPLPYPWHFHKLHTSSAARHRMAVQGIQPQLQLGAWIPNTVGTIALAKTNSSGNPKFKTLVFQCSKFKPPIVSCKMFATLLYVAVSYYSDKLAHLKFFINCQFSIAQMCTRKDMLAHYLGALYFDDVMSYNAATSFCH